MAHDVRYDEDEERPTWEELDSGRPPKPQPEDYRAAAEFLGIGRQEGMTREASAVLVGPVRDRRHGEVQAELRRIQVSVRGQMDGIRPIEAVVLTYRWVPDRAWPDRDVAWSGWVFEELQPLVQGLDGTLKPGTVLSAEDVALLGPSLGWAWALVHALRPRG